ncbi:MAG: DHHA1 domain-containing protein [Maledivibacter sp.]|nr:DHHA1 domain-containing protein [Maledivibacter sp.]
MTIKLFYKNTYIKEFNANILQILEEDNKYHLELSQTAFYPEGGGQPSDIGYIEDNPVSHVYEKQDKIYHVVDKLPSKLETVNCRIDWEKRFDHMQQHLGQHILSAAFEKLHDAKTIGFHLSENSLTIDIDKVLSNKDIRKVEYFTNQIVFNDLSVQTIYPKEDELANMPLRKVPTVTENIRIVKLDDFDYSPCCGTHPNRTGEVGLIKIRKYEKYKSGLRVDFVCGNRALKDYLSKNDIVNSISSNLSVKQEEVLNSVERITTEFQDMKKENKYLKSEIINLEAIDLLSNAEIIHNIKIIKKTYCDRELGEIKQLSSSLVNDDSRIVILGIVTNNQARLLFSRSKNLNQINMKEILNDCIPLIDGKGGGSPFSAQGGGQNIDNLQIAVDTAYKAIKEQL